MSFFRVVQHDSRSMQWWHQQCQAGYLDLEPKYQRRSDIWSKYKQAHLIDSIINGYDLPKFYVADFTLAQSSLNESRMPYAVVDGKQRFGAFFSFLTNKLPLNRSTVYEADRSLLIRGLTFEELRSVAPSLAAKIQDFSPVVMSIITDDQKKIDEMFIRLNSGVAANSAERRNAQPGPVPMLVRELVDHAFFRDRIRFNKKRMADLQVAMKLMLIEHAGELRDTKAGNLDRFVKHAASETAPESFEEEVTEKQQECLVTYIATKDRIVDVLENLAEAFVSNDPALNASGRMPVYYWVMRNHPESKDNFRDFVIEFEASVLDAMRASRDGQHADPILVNYYTLSRTSNDQQSMLGRYKIIVNQMRLRHLIN